MKRKISLILTLVLMLSTLVTVSVSAASWPSLGAYSYCEFIAPKTINVYTSMYLNTRGTSSPSKKYNAYIDKGDSCRIFRIDSTYIHLAYPTSSGYKQGFIKRSDLFNVSSPSDNFKSKSSVTTYKYAGSSSYGSTAKNDAIYKVGTSGNYTQIIYTAKSGSRAYKAGWVSNSDYNKIKGTSTSSSTTSSTSLLFPLKGSITRSSSIKTSGIYCDYKASKNTPVYAPANGTVEFVQRYSTTNNKLMSYGNYIKFTSSDGVYEVKCCHLNSFNNVSLKYTSSLSYPCGVSNYPSYKDYVVKTKTVKQGELLGYSGMTGNASGPHLHIEVKKNGTPVNPTSVFKTW